jgi:transmembrane sensor
MTDVDWDLLFRYFGSECTAEERERFEQWLASDPNHRVLVDAAVVAAGRTLDRGPASSSVVHIMPRRPAAVRRAWWALAAASFLIVAGSTFVWRSVGLRAFGTPESAPRLDMARTGRGQREALRLGDGTHVVLGPSSTLRYPVAFARRSREVYLTGEGYFEVKHDARRPFRVHTGTATAEDLGTAFSVRAYAEDSAVRVVVAEGMVALGAKTLGTVHGTVVTRGELARLTKGSTVPSVERVNVEAYLGWTKGRLAFDEAPLSEVVAQLGRWYDAQFRIADSSLVSRRLTASFTDESLTEVLRMLAPVLDVRFERVGNSVVVHPPQRRR